MTKMQWGRNTHTRRGPPADSASPIARTELYRQRRELLWLTFALVIYYCAGVQLGHEAESQGFKLSIQNPQFLVWGAWCAWMWALLGYWQYERTHPDSSYGSWRDHEMWLAAVEIGKRKVHSEKSREQFQEPPMDFSLEISMDREIETGLTMDGGLHIKNYGITRKSADGRTTDRGTATANLSARELMFAQRQGARDFVVKRPYALDYKAPYILALLAPGAWLWVRLF